MSLYETLIDAGRTEIDASIEARDASRDLDLVGTYWVEPWAPLRHPVRGVGALFARLRAGCTWVERVGGNDVRLARRPELPLDVWTPGHPSIHIRPEEDA